ncbi:Hypothetical_protein [Hexamita inflata]|uniref:Hypothetical_protein n=1 Tax=Hexamita inflata TaxID=28002 RepID=A0AA86Q178_9EUKA|nr:Hypothetical protein HINF_LOCUS36401 [Hexamita inflata]
MKHSIDYSSFIQTNSMSSDQILVAMMKCNLDYSSFVQSNNMSSSEIINAASKSDLSLQEKQQLLSKYTDVKLEQKEINSALIKREYEKTSERVVQFINSKHNEIAIELAFKEVLLQQEKNGNKNIAEQIQELKTRIQDLQRINAEQKIEFEQKISECQQKYNAELIKCRNEVEAQMNEYQQDLKKEYEKYKTEIEQLKKVNEIEKQCSNKINEQQQKKYASDQEIDMNDTIANQLRDECELLQQQLIEEKQDHEEQYAIMQQLLKHQNQRNAVIQKQLTEEKKQRITFFEKLQQKQSEITKQLEQNVKDQASKILSLESEKQSLQNTLSALKEQIEKLNVSEYQKVIDKQKIQLKDNQEFITQLKEEITNINNNHLQDKQVEKVIGLLKAIKVSE